ncbi:hypothetical protein [Rhizobium mongolense]|uniref:Uncharacterized protein n=1 Tax=Rhizobium mongolense TaxID=57676 RepID=A0A7W6WEC0_9HYPH|nr:hypothetical protein [Rhizobium mongolense]MBB4275287.1 hypothetical protein [Rhizobium mongolense]
MPVIGAVIYGVDLEKLNGIGDGIGDFVGVTESCHILRRSA